MSGSEIDPISTARELATHANQIAHIEGDLTTMKDNIDAIKTAVQNIEITLERAFGESAGKAKTLATVIGISGVLGGGLVWFANRLFPLH